MNKYLKIVLITSLFAVFIVIRAFSTKLFYDPLVYYFLNDYLYTTVPDIDITRLATSMFFRYTLNAIVSLCIVWLLFNRKDYVKFSIYFYTVAFLILMSIFMYLLKDKFQSGYLLPFYVRRFIIQPLFILILLPAFYYQKLSKR